MLKNEMLEGRTHLTPTHGRRLLIVDNDRRIVDLLKETFLNMSYRVEVSYCGEAAIVKNNIGKYPCAIVDYSLPDMKGDELATGLRAATPKIGLVLLTGFKNAIPSDSLNLFNCVFEKPANLEQLEDAVDRLIEQSRQQEIKPDTTIQNYLVNQAQVSRHFNATN